MRKRKREEYEPLGGRTAEGKMRKGAPVRFSLAAAVKATAEINGCCRSHKPIDETTVYDFRFNSYLLGQTGRREFLFRSILNIAWGDIDITRSKHGNTEKHHATDGHGMCISCWCRIHGYFRTRWDEQYNLIVDGARVTQPRKPRELSDKVCVCVALSIIYVGTEVYYMVGAHICGIR